MSHFDTFGKRCCVDTVDLVFFFLAFLNYRGWKARILDFSASPAPRGGHVLAKKIQEKGLLNERKEFTRRKPLLPLSLYPFSFFLPGIWL